MLYPLSYGGVHATNDAVGFIPPILSSPSSVSDHRLPQGEAVDLAETTSRLSDQRPCCDGTEPIRLPGPVRPTRLAAVVASPACRRYRTTPSPFRRAFTLAGGAGPRPRADRQVCSLLRLLSPFLAKRCPRLLFRGAHLYVAVGKFL